jgi:sporulation protein YlmC with PRC-barrel domain
VRLTTAAGRRLVTTSAIEGASVRSTAGDKLGTVNSVVLDLEEGKVVYFVLSIHGGLFGAGGKYTPAPWNVFSIDRDGEGFVTTIDRKTLAAAPAYDRDQLNSEVYAWGEQVKRYFGSPT